MLLCRTRISSVHQKRAPPYGIRWNSAQPSVVMTSLHHTDNRLSSWRFMSRKTCRQLLIMYRGILKRRLVRRHLLVTHAAIEAVVKSLKVLLTQWRHLSPVCWLTTFRLTLYGFARRLSVVLHCIKSLSVKRFAFYLIAPQRYCYRQVKGRLKSYWSVWH